MSLEDHTAAALALRHPRVADLLRTHGVRYCCEGDVTLAATCRDAERAEEKACALLSRIEELVEDDGAGGLAPGALDTEELLVHIVERHHDHVWARAPFLAQMAAELAALQLDTTRELFPIAQLLKDVERALTAHLRREEGLYRGLFEGVISAPALASALQLVGRDHAHIGALVERLRRRTNGYRPPAGASNAHRGLFRELDELDTHVRSQVLLEEHVLQRRLRDDPERAV